MGKRTHLLVVVVAALFATAIASVAAVASSVETALGCSIAGPTATARPAENLDPGQTIEITGWGFQDIRFREPVPEPAPRPDPLATPAAGDAAIPEVLCDFDTSPLTGLPVVWNGAVRHQLGVVDGPEFVLIARVPADAVAGPASITIGPATISVHVGAALPPPPCPLTPSPDGSTARACPDPEPDPDPWPCPLYEAQTGAAPPAPGAAVAPGFPPPCPEPCIDHAHTIDQGTADDYRWDCPHPCAYPEVNPGAEPGATPQDTAAPEAMAVWCPPADPRALAGEASRSGSAETAAETASPTATATAAPNLGTTAAGDQATVKITAMAQRVSRIALQVMALLFG